MGDMVKIRDICDVFDGPHATPKRVETGPVYLGIKALNKDGTLNPSEYTFLSEIDFVKWTKRVTPKTGDIVFSYEATLGRYALIPERFHGCLGRRLAVIRTKSDSVNIKWLYYYLRSPEWTAFISNQRISGSTVDRISIGEFPNYQVNLPSRLEQDQIAEILGNIDEKINTSNQAIAVLQRIANTIYNYWFVQFDFPNKGGKPYRTSGGKMVYNETLKREIPEGWEVGTLANLGDIVGGGTPSTTNNGYYSDNGIAWITPKDLSDRKSKYVTHGDRDITKEGLSNSSAILMPAGAVIMSSRAPIGLIAIATSDISTNQGCKSIVPREPFISEYIAQVLRSNLPGLISQGGGTTFKEISKDTLANYAIAIPRREIIEAYNKVAGPIGKTIINTESEIKELSNLRDWLLPMLMNGQVRVDESANTE